MEQPESVDQDLQQPILNPLNSSSPPFSSPKINIKDIPEQDTKQAEIISNPFLRQYILLGYGAKGIIYFLIGILAIEAAILPERKAAGTYNALKHLSDQPLGSVVLCLLAIVLIGYVLRRLLQAVIYPGHSSGLSFSSLLQRMGYILSSISYAGVAYSALSIVFKLGKYNDHIQEWVERLFDRAVGGEEIVFVVGIGVAGVGIGYLYGAYTGSYIGQFAASDIDYRLEYWAKLMGKIGIAARGVAFIVTGSCLILASVVSDSGLAGGLQNAFQVLAVQPLGWLWLSLIGSGFIAYGIYMFIAARYRRYAIR